MTNPERRIIACPCTACGAQPLHRCSTPDGKLGIWCPIPEGQTPLQDWTLLAFHATDLWLKSQEPIPIRITCEGCGELHIDEGEFLTKPHHTHSCQHCGLPWRPAIVHTVGVRFLPGFKNDPPPIPKFWKPGDPTGPTGNIVGPDRKATTITGFMLGDLVRKKGTDEIFKVIDFSKLTGQHQCEPLALGQPTQWLKPSDLEHLPQEGERPTEPETHQTIAKRAALTEMVIVPPAPVEKPEDSEFAAKKWWDEHPATREFGTQLRGGVRSEAQERVYTKVEAWERYQRELTEYEASVKSANEAPEDPQ